MQTRPQPFSGRRRCTNGSVLRISSFSFALFFVICVLLSGSRPVSAADGREFVGTFELTDIFDQSDAFVATFTARVFNYSDTDVSDATVVLESRVVPGQTYWSFPSVSMVDRGSVRLRGIIKIPKAEYKAWQQGSRPNMHLDTANPDGTYLRRMVELARNLIVEEK